MCSYENTARAVVEDTLLCRPSQCKTDKPYVIEKVWVETHAFAHYHKRYVFIEYNTHIARHDVEDPSRMFNNCDTLSYALHEALRKEGNTLKKFYPICNASWKVLAREFDIHTARGIPRCDR
jgi:hypothetical protein